MRAARKVDHNHTAIVQALRGVGCAVLDLSMVGGGVPDLYVEHVSTGFAGFLEVKNPSGRNRVDPRQVAWITSWRGRSRVWLVRSTDEALVTIGVLGGRPAGGE